MPGSYIGNRHFIFAASVTMAVATASMLSPTPGFAQSSDSVSVNLNALNDLDPAKTQPRLLMPSAQPRSSRIVLTPPAGVERITPQAPRVVLRPPPGAPARIASAPTISVPAPAAAAVAPPTRVTAPPAPPPRPDVSRAPTSPPPSPVPEQIVATVPEATPTLDAAVEVAAQPQPEETAPVNMPTPNTDDQVAAVPDASMPASEPVSIVFGPEETELPPTAESALVPLAAQMAADESLRLRLMAYAEADDESPSNVRRTSLRRAIAVREFLIDQGIRSTRIEVRALGDQSEGGNPDRVDAIVDQR